MPNMLKGKKKAWIYIARETNDGSTTLLGMAKGEVSKKWNTLFDVTNIKVYQLQDRSGNDALNYIKSKTLVFAKGVEPKYLNTGKEKPNHPQPLWYELSDPLAFLKDNQILEEQKQNATNQNNIGSILSEPGNKDQMSSFTWELDDNQSAIASSNLKTIVTNALPNTEPNPAGKFPVNIAFEQGLNMAEQKYDIVDFLAILESLQQTLKDVDIPNIKERDRMSNHLKSLISISYKISSEKVPEIVDSLQTPVKPLIKNPTDAPEMFHTVRHHFSQRDDYKVAIFKLPKIENSMATSNMGNSAVTGVPEVDLAVQSSEGQRLPFGTFKETLPQRERETQPALQQREELSIDGGWSPIRNDLIGEPRGLPNNVAVIQTDQLEQFSTKIQKFIEDNLNELKKQMKQQQDQQEKARKKPEKTEAELKEKEERKQKQKQQENDLKVLQEQMTKLQEQMVQQQKELENAKKEQSRVEAVLKEQEEGKQQEVDLNVLREQMKQQQLQIDKHTEELEETRKEQEKIKEELREREKQQQQDSKVLQTK